MLCPGLKAANLLFRGKLLHVPAIITHACRRSPYRFPCLLAMIFLALQQPAAAHEIPNDVTAQLFVNPAGRHLNLLARLPLRAVRDVLFPERGGYLDIEKTNPLLPNL